MKRAIFSRLVLLTLIAIVVCSLVSSMIYAFYTQNQTQEWLTKLTLATAENYKNNTAADALASAAGGNRITIIAPDGRVLADSQDNAVITQNHADREEVKGATTGSVYVAIRTSRTLGETFMYASIKADDGNILRLAYAYDGLFHNLAVQWPAMLAAIAAALVLATGLARGFTLALTRPLEQVVDALSVGEYARLAEGASSYYEIDKLMQSIQTLLQRIAAATRSLRDEREKVDYILANMAEGFVLVGDENQVLLCNNSAKEFFAVKPELSVGTLYQLTREPALLSAVELALGQAQSTMFDLRLHDGRVLNAYVSPTRTPENQVSATLLLVDMTAAKQLEAQKREFFANASHELKTPITSVLGFAEMLNRGMVPDEEKAAILSRVETESRRLSALINDILTISKLESGALAAEQGTFDFAEVLREAVDAVSPLKDGTPITIRVQATPTPYHADKRQIYQLCVNLIDNAVKYNKPNGEVTLSLETRDGGLVLTITDTGIGIPPEYHARIFERFFRIDQGRDKKVGGTGLGLSIVKHIVQAHHGKITIQSTKRVGTTIVVSLPINM